MAVQFAAKFQLCADKWKYDVKNRLYLTIQCYIFKFWYDFYIQSVPISRIINKLVHCINNLLVQSYLYDDLCHNKMGNIFFSRIWNQITNIYCYAKPYKDNNNQTIFAHYSSKIPALIKVLVEIRHLWKKNCNCHDIKQKINTLMQLHLAERSLLQY